MTREAKIALLVGLGVVLLVGVLISDHLATQRQPDPPDLEGQVVEQARPDASQRPGAPPSAIRPGMRPGIDGVRASAYGPSGSPAGPGSAGSTNTAANDATPRDRSPQSTPPTTADDQPPTRVSPFARPAPSESLIIAAAPPAPPTSTADTQTNTQLNAVPTPRDPARHSDRPDSPLAGIEALVARSNEALRQPGSNPVVANASIANASIAKPDAPLPAPPPEPDTLIHEVRSGESLYVIAQRYYHDGMLWRRLAQANPDKVSLEGHVRVGTKLRIPSPGTLIDRDAVTILASRQADRPAVAAGGQDPTPPASRASPRTYVVQAGDTLSEIAMERLGSLRYWRELLTVNDDLDTAADLRAGMVIQLPAVGLLAEGTRSGASEATAATPQSQAQPPSEPKPWPHTYIVQEGDSLASISRDLWDTPDRWRDLFEANRERIDDANRLQVGLTLRIPR